LAKPERPFVGSGLSRHPRWIFYFIPTSASWRNAVENFFSKMTRQRIRGVFRSIADLRAAINAYLEHQCQSQTVCLDKSAGAILAQLDRLPVPSV
jgi:transposase